MFYNDIGDLAARQILEGLIMRKENKLPKMKIKVDYRISQETFQAINKLSGGKGSKKKKKK